MSISATTSSEFLRYADVPVPEPNKRHTECNPDNNVGHTCGDEKKLLQLTRKLAMPTIPGNAVDNTYISQTERLAVVCKSHQRHPAENQPREDDGIEWNTCQWVDHAEILHHPAERILSPC